MDVQLRFADLPTAPLLEVCDLNKTYARGRWGSTSRSSAVALDNVNLTLFPCSTLALVGKSGSGKSTLARCLALLDKPDSGEIRFEGVNVNKLSSSELKRKRRCIQLVWQHSALALNPHFSAADIVAEPLRIQRAGSKGEQREQALTMMFKLGMPPSIASHTPSQLSGGQRQRLAIARALVMNPAVLIFDEALAGLDLPLQAQIVKLLADLKRSHSLSYIFISHDLRMAASFSDKMAVMQNGRIVEEQTVRELISFPQHTASRELIESIPAKPIP